MTVPDQLIALMIAVPTLFHLVLKVFIPQNFREMQALAIQCKILITNLTDTQSNLISGVGLNWKLNSKTNFGFDAQ